MVRVEPERFQKTADGGARLAVAVGPKAAKVPDERMPVGAVGQGGLPLEELGRIRSLHQDFSQPRVGLDLIGVLVEDPAKDGFRIGDAVLDQVHPCLAQQHQRIVRNVAEALVDERAGHSP